MSRKSQAFQVLYLQYRANFLRACPALARWLAYLLLPSHISSLSGSSLDRLELKVMHSYAFLKPQNLFRLETLIEVTERLVAGKVGLLCGRSCKSMQRSLVKGTTCRRNFASARCLLSPKLRSLSSSPCCVSAIKLEFSPTSPSVVHVARLLVPCQPESSRGKDLNSNQCLPPSDMFASHNSGNSAVLITLLTRDRSGNLACRSERKTRPKEEHAIGTVVLSVHS